MAANPWNRLSAAVPAPMAVPWLETMLARNSGTAYLRAYGSPRTMDEFREQVPVVCYEEMTPWLDCVRGGVLFTGSPIAFERTGGSTGAAKLIPYSAEGLLDFQRCVVPWLQTVVNTHGITGRAYFSISPATR
ncbi:MAG TPA: GH3 auxin-responsive promoter family protein, partial [Thermoanaerobaculia bacterium]